MRMLLLLLQPPAAVAAAVVGFAQGMAAFACQPHFKGTDALSRPKA